MEINEDKLYVMGITQKKKGSSQRKASRALSVISNVNKVINVTNIFV